MPDWTECQTKLWGIAVLIVVIGLHVFIIGDYKCLVYVKSPRSVLRLERMPTFYWTIYMPANVLSVREYVACARVRVCEAFQVNREE